VSSADTPDHSFEDAIAELEQVVRTLEDGTTSLDGGLAAYERGVVLLKCCFQHLRQAEQRILKLTGNDGRPSLELFEHTAAVEAERPENRRRKKPSEPEFGRQ
jgi:exodeoxyribonuclease VII small subunit